MVSVIRWVVTVNCCTSYIYTSLVRSEHFPVHLRASSQIMSLVEVATKPTWLRKGNFGMRDPCPGTQAWQAAWWRLAARSSSTLFSLGQQGGQGSQGRSTGNQSAGCHPRAALLSVPLESLLKPWQLLRGGKKSQLKVSTTPAG